MRSLRRLGLFTLSLSVVAALTAVVGNAASTITTPNSALINYTLTSGATSSPVTPATNQPVLVIGANIGTTDFAVSTVTLVHIPSKEIKWIGIEPTGALTHNGSAALGTHIIYLDNTSKVSLEVFSADQFVIHNASTGSESGSVKLIW
jgi:hypothetical protein